MNDKHAMLLGGVISLFPVAVRLCAAPVSLIILDLNRFYSLTFIAKLILKVLIPHSDLFHQRSFTLCLGFVFLGASGLFLAAVEAWTSPIFLPQLTLLGVSCACGGDRTVFVTGQSWYASGDILSSTSFLHPVSAHQRVFFPAFASPSLVLWIKTLHLCCGVFVWDIRIPFFMAVTQLCFIICVTHRHTGSFKVKLKCIRPSVPLCFHLVRTSEGPKNVSQGSLRHVRMRC